MLRARARGGFTSVVVPLAAATALLSALVSGCGAAGGSSASGSGGSAATGAAPSEETVACRARWKDLAAEASGHDGTQPSALPQRWTSVSATIDYYATSGTAKDCGDPLTAQRKAMAALASFGTKLQRYDLEKRFAEVRNDAEDYASGPRPAPTKQQAKKGRRATRVPAPEPSAVAAALKTLEKQAPRATRDQGPAWQQAEVAELSDDRAVAKAVKDLKFLSQESAAYRAGVRALAQIRAAVKLAG